MPSTLDANQEALRHSGRKIRVARMVWPSNLYINAVSRRFALCEARLCHANDSRDPAGSFRHPRIDWRLDVVAGPSRPWRLLWACQPTRGLHSRKRHSASFAFAFFISVQSVSRTACPQHSTSPCRRVRRHLRRQYRSSISNVIRNSNHGNHQDCVVHAGCSCRKHVEGIRFKDCRARGEPSRVAAVRGAEQMVVGAPKSAGSLDVIGSSGEHPSPSARHCRGTLGATGAHRRLPTLRRTVRHGHFRPFRALSATFIPSCRGADSGGPFAGVANMLGANRKGVHAVSLFSK